MKYAITFDGSIPEGLLEAFSELVALKVIQKIEYQVPGKLTADQKKVIKSEVEKMNQIPGDITPIRIPVRDREPEKVSESDKKLDLTLHGSASKRRKKGKPLQEPKMGRE